MIHSRETSPPPLIQPRPTRAASPPHATGLHGVGSLREGLSTTTPQPSTPTRTSSGLYWRPGCHQSLASQHMASPDHKVKGSHHECTSPVTSAIHSRIHLKIPGHLSAPAVITDPKTRRGSHQRPGQRTAVGMLSCETHTDVCV